MDDRPFGLLGSDSLVTLREALLDRYWKLTSTTIINGVDNAERTAEAVRVRRLYATIVDEQYERGELK